MLGRKLVIQVPCFNEEETLPITVGDLPRDVDGFDVVEWLVIDDGSSDRTAELARELGVDHVIQHDRNRGLAAAFLTGLDAALRCGADVIVNTDADNQYDASGIPDLTAPIVEGHADMVVGERPIETIDEFSFVKKRLQRLGSWVVRRFSATPVRDAASGFRAMSRDTAMRLQVFGRYTYTMETLIQAGWEGLTVVSVPIGTNPETRPSRLVRSVPRYVARSASTIIRSFVLYKPFRFFLLVGLIPFIAGLLLLGRWLFLYFFAEEYSSRLPSLLGGFGALLVASQIWAVAFLADLQTATRRLVSNVRYEQRRAQLEGRADATGPLQRHGGYSEVDPGDDGPTQVAAS